MHAAPAPAGLAPTLDVLPDLSRSPLTARDLVLPLALLLEFVGGVVGGLLI